VVIRSYPLPFPSAALGMTAGGRWRDAQEKGGVVKSWTENGS
jgi:CRISPR/Cas system-associated protein Cas5 (RAMP superfamily)